MVLVQHELEKLPQRQLFYFISLLERNFLLPMYFYRRLLPYHSEIKGFINDTLILSLQINNFIKIPSDSTSNLVNRIFY